MSRQGKEQPSSGSHKPLTRRAFTIFFIGALLYFLFSQRQAFIQIFQTLSIYYLFIIFVFSVLNNAAGGIRFFIVVHQKDNRISIMDGLKLYALGRMLGLILPQSGNVYRFIHLKKKYNFSFDAYVEIFMALLWLTTFVSLVGTLAVLNYFGGELTLMGFDGTRFILMLTFFWMTIPLLGSCIRFKKGVKPSWSRRLLDRALKVSVSVRTLISSPSLLGRFLIISVISFFLTGALFYYGFKNIGIAPDFRNLALIVTMMKISAVVNITPGNIGLMEFLSGYISHATGLLSVQGVLVMLQVRIVSLLAVIAMGFFWGWKDIFYPGLKR